MKREREEAERGEEARESEIPVDGIGEKVRIEEFKHHVRASPVIRGRATLNK